MTAESDLDACYDSAARIIRVETLGEYKIASEAERIAAFRDGTPRPVRSVRTSDYLAEVAVTTVTQGKLWQRFRVMELYQSLATWYQRYQITGYLEAQAAGEEIFIVPPMPAVLACGDFTLFDETAAAFQSYDAEGALTGIRVSADPAEVAACAAVVAEARTRAVPLNAYLASRPRAQSVA